MEPGENSLLNSLYSTFGFFWLLKFRRTPKEIFLFSCFFKIYFMKFLRSKCLYCISNGFLMVNFTLEGLFRFFFMVKLVIIKKDVLPSHQN